MLALIKNVNHKTQMNKITLATATIFMITSISFCSPNKEKVALIEHNTTI